MTDETLKTDKKPWEELSRRLSFCEPWSRFLCEQFPPMRTPPGRSTVTILVTNQALHHFRVGIVPFGERDFKPYMIDLESPIIAGLLLAFIDQHNRSTGGDHALFVEYEEFDEDNIVDAMNERDRLSDEDIDLRCHNFFEGYGYEVRVWKSGAIGVSSDPHPNLGVSAAVGVYRAFTKQIKQAMATYDKEGSHVG